MKITQYFVILLTVVSTMFSCKSESMEEVIVIGGGLMGSSTAWELAKSGVPVLLLEQQGPDYTFGSSFGEARISRNLGPENDIFGYLQKTSVIQTKELISFLNENSTKSGHNMSDIYTTSPVTYIFYSPAEYQSFLENNSLQVEFASSPEEARLKFGMDIPKNAMVIREFKEYSGTLNPHVLISKLHEGIIKAGGAVHYNQHVTGVKKQGDHFKIDLTNSSSGEMHTILSKRVVAAAGPYNGRLLRVISPYIEKLITPQRLFLSFLKINDEKYAQLTENEKNKIRNFYPVADLNEDIFYSMIEEFNEAGSPLIKVGGHLLRSDIADLDNVWKKELNEHEIQWSKINTLRYLHLLNLPVASPDIEYVKGYSCVYSLTDSETPYVTNVIDADNAIDSNLVLVGGMSGIGAKGSLAYGLIAADILLDRTDTSAMYLKTRNELGVERLKEDIIQRKSSKKQAYYWH